MKKTLAILLSLALVICMIPSAAFATEQTDISNATVEWSTAETSFLYDGNSHQVTVNKITLPSASNPLASDAYTVSWKKNGATPENYKSAGEYTVEITGVEAEGYKGSISRTFTIVPVDLTNATITKKVALTDADIVDGTAADTKTISSHTTKISVKQNGIEVSPNFYNLTCTVSGSNVRVSVTAKKPTEDVAGKDAASTDIIVDSTKSADFALQTSLDANYGISTIPEQTYTGSAIEPTITVTRTSSNTALPVTLTKGTHYTVAYKNNIAGGQSGTVTVTGIGSFTGFFSRDFYIAQRSLTASGISVTASDVIYNNGNPIVPNVIVMDGTKKLTEGTDYTVSCTNTAIGSATAVVEGIGNYKGTVSKNFNIVDSNKGITNSNAWIYIGYSDANSYKTYYNGYAQTPAVTVRVGATKESATLLDSTYYTVTYSDNIKGNASGYATITITGRNGYAGQATTTFQILPTEITKYNTTISGYSTSYAYTGSYITPAVSVSVNGYPLTAGKHYTVSYTNNRNISTTYSKGRITITAISGSGYTGSTYVEFTIAGKSIYNCTAAFTNGRSSSAYTGSAIKPAITVRDGYYTILKEGIDYTISYKNAAGKVVSSMKDAGTYTVVITGKGNYSGEKTLTYEITGSDISGYTVTLRESSVKADGYSKTPSIASVKKDYFSTLSSADYTVSYQDATGKTVTSMSAPGTYRVVVTGKNGYSGTTYATFRIVGLTQTVTVTQDSYKVYDDSDAFKITAKATGDGTGFTYTSSNPTVASVSYNGVVTPHKVGRAVITVTTTGNKKSEPASEDVTVKVYPNKGKISQKPWTNGKKAQMKVRWNYQDGVTKYQIRYSRDKNFKSGTYLTKTVNAHGKDYTTQSTTLTKLKRGYTYYFKVRAVYTDPVTGDNYYGSWSGWRSAKTI